jgi:hypothetical protein
MKRATAHQKDPHLLGPRLRVIVGEAHSAGAVASRADLGAAGRLGAAGPVVHFGQSKVLSDFCRSAAQEGLPPADAVLLAIQHLFVISDARHLLIATGAARHALNRAAADARPAQPLSPAVAAYLRRLGRGPWGRPADATALSVGIPPRFADRLRVTRDSDVLRPDVLPEAISWERAAVVTHRTMAEWALLILARRARAD